LFTIFVNSWANDQVLAAKKLEKSETKPRVTKF